MAGTDQSVNLSGMLNQIAGTIGEGYQIDGKNAGAAMGGVIANSVKPELDMNDPVSLKRYAGWARNNGMTEEAMRYEAKAAELSKQAQTMDAMVGSGEVFQAGGEAAQAGDLKGLAAQTEAAVAGMREARAKNDINGMRYYQQTLQQLKGMQGQASTQQTKNTAAGLAKVNGLIDAGVTPEGKPLSKDQAASLEARRAEMMEDPEAVAMYTQQVAEQGRLRREEEAVADDEAMGAFLKANSGASIEELEKAYADVPEERSAAVYSVMETLRSARERDDKRKAEADAAGVAIASESAVADIQATIDALDADAAPGAKRAAQGLLDAAVAADQAMFVNGTYAVGTRGKAEQVWTNKINQVTQMVASSVAATDARGRRKEDAAESTYERIQMERLSPIPTTAVNAYAKAWDVSPEEAEDALKQQRDAEFREAEKILYPELAAAKAKAVEEGLNPEWSDDQQDYMRKLANVSPQIADALMQEGGWSVVENAVMTDETIPADIKAGWIELASANGMLEDTKPASEAASTPYVQPLVDLWSLVNSGESSRKTRKQVRDK